MTAQSSSLIEAYRISKTFRTWRGADLHALRDVSINIQPGEIYGLVGESGSGKSTLSRILIGIETQTSGEVRVGGTPVRTKKDLFSMRREVQYVFQDPFGSLPPGIRVGKILEDPLIIHRLGTAAQRQAAIREVIELVGLKQSDLDCFPAVFSGGQRQRISLARALVTRPRLLICDEITSGLDVSVQAQILNLLLTLNEELGMAYLLVSHDLRVIRYLCNRVGVMRSGEIVEEGTTAGIFGNPAHPYSRLLIDSIPSFERPDTAEFLAPPLGPVVPASPAEADES